MTYEREIAEAALDIHAIKIRPDDPFTWASDFRMPIYNNNRMFLFYPEHRRLLAQGFEEILASQHIPYDVIAGTSTAGIPPATTLADHVNKPMIYVRESKKGHGLENQIEGIDSESDLQGSNVVLIEDLISTGGSSARAVQAIRDAKGECHYCLCVFNYGLDKAVQTFEDLHPRCEARSLLTYDTLLEVGKEKGYIDEGQANMLAEWRADPFHWGAKHGFPKVEK